tara:strand:- start:367 stop:600 length:234 start_codon:yes stop_codon:yes gene_type:complete
MAFNMKKPSLLKMVSALKVDLTKKSGLGPRAKKKKEKKKRTNKEVLDAIDKEETIGTRIDEGSIESQALRRKENNKK